MAEGYYKDTSYEQDKGEDKKLTLNLIQDGVTT